MIKVIIGFISGAMVGVEILDRSFDDAISFGIAIDLVILRVIILKFKG